MTLRAIIEAVMLHGRTGAAFCLVLCLGQAGAASQQPGSTAAEIELPDQLGGSDSVTAHRGQVTVAMVVTAARLRNLKAWRRDLEERLDGIDFVLIADIPIDPPASLDRVVAKLAERVPNEVPVLIDLERRWAVELGLDTDRPNILLFDREGRLVASFRGRSEPSLVDAVVQRLHVLVGE
jgi:hypothetical protein